MAGGLRLPLCTQPPLTVLSRGTPLPAVSPRRGRCKRLGNRRGGAVESGQTRLPSGSPRRSSRSPPLRPWPHQPGTSSNHARREARSLHTREDREAAVATSHSLPFTGKEGSWEKSERNPEGMGTPGRLGGGGARHTFITGGKIWSGTKVGQSVWKEGIS